MTAWFTPTTVEERLGGSILFDLGGGMTSAGTITEWDPERRRLCYEERDWSGDAPPIATEVTVVARSGDTCVVRMVHSLFTTLDTWDDEIEGFEKGWQGFFEVLAIYLRDFAGQRGACGHGFAMVPAPIAEVWKACAKPLGLEGVHRGDRVEAPAGVPAFAGTVESIHELTNIASVLVRLTAPCPGVAIFGGYQMGTKTRVAAMLFCYGETAPAEAARSTAAWSEWLASAYPTPPAS
jgi:hypothetical protein